MQIAVLRDNSRGVLDLDGVTHEVDLSLIEDPRVGDYVIVHAGFAIEKLDADEAEKTLSLLREIEEAVP